MSLHTEFMFGAERDVRAFNQALTGLGVVEYWSGLRYTCVFNAKDMNGRNVDRLYQRVRSIAQMHGGTELENMPVRY
jgi:hypothetical protein